MRSGGVIGNMTASKFVVLGSNPSRSAKYEKCYV